MVVYFSDAAGISQTKSRPPTMFFNFSPILYLGKATAKLHVGAHRVERQGKKRKHFGVESSGKRNYSPTGLCVCVFMWPLYSVCRIRDLFHGSVTNTSDLRVLSTTSVEGAMKFNVRSALQDTVTFHTRKYVFNVKCSVSVDSLWFSHLDCRSRLKWNSIQTKTKLSNFKF